MHALHVLYNLKENDQHCVMNLQFFERVNPDKTIGEVVVTMGEDLSIDINYMEGEAFKLKDCTHYTDRIGISAVVNECIAFNNTLVDLFELIRSHISSQLIPSLIPSLFSMLYPIG